MDRNTLHSSIAPLDARLAALRDRLSQSRDCRPRVCGKLVRVVGLTLEATGLQVPIGSYCQVEAGEPDGLVEAEVVGFASDRLYLMPVGAVRGLRPGAKVIPVGHAGEVRVGRSLLGRVMGGAGGLIDGGSDPILNHRIPLLGEPINPLNRRLITEPMDIGIRAINALFTLGRGQRIGLFAGSGVGKSTLLGLMTRFSDADVVVVGLIGERGREVQEFINEILGPQGLARAIVVAAPADDSPLTRLHGAWRATALAEYFRGQGLNVLLLMDSLTRVAQAQREIALAIGEPPVTKGYPPSVFTLLPRLVERTGNLGANGSITAIYTVLVEGDDLMDPIADTARAILDGHISLSREIAEGGRYPAIDIANSVSRVTSRLLDSSQREQIMRFKALYSVYQQNRDLINIGAYTPGSNAQIDQAVIAHPRLEEFLRQGENEKVTLDQSNNQMRGLMGALAQGSPV